MDNDLEKVSLMGGKRAHLTPTDVPDWDWWVGWGKDESCQFEGPWQHMAVIAAKILRHENTKKVAPNLFRPDLVLTEEQENNY